MRHLIAMETLVSRDQHKTWLKADIYMSYYAHMYAILSFDSFLLKFDPSTWIISRKVEIDFITYSKVNFELYL